MTEFGDAHRMVVERAVSDPEFRARLLTDPRAAVTELLGVDLPEDVTITVVEQAPTEAVIVLPAAPAAEGAVADQELTEVAGGGWIDATGRNSCECRVTAGIARFC